MQQAELGQARLPQPKARPAASVAARRGQSALDAEPFWPAQLTAAAALVLYVTLPHALIMGPKWLVPGVEGVLLLGLVITTPTRHHNQSPQLRAVIVGLLGLVSLTTLTSLILYTSYTNATAFSPTDTLPLSALAKLLMAIQSLIALITTLLVIVRAVNVLG